MVPFFLFSAAHANWDETGKLPVTPPPRVSFSGLRPLTWIGAIVEVGVESASASAKSKNAAFGQSMQASSKRESLAPSSPCSHYSPPGRSIQFSLSLVLTLLCSAAAKTTVAWLLPEHKPIKSPSDRTRLPADAPLRGTRASTRFAHQFIHSPAQGSRRRHWRRNLVAGLPWFQ
jgi:hypothetical protein